MAFDMDIKRILEMLKNLKRYKETMLVWGLGIIAFILLVSLLFGYFKKQSPSAGLGKAARKRDESLALRDKEEVAEEAIEQLQRTQRVSLFSKYEEVIRKNLFRKDRRDELGGGPQVGGVRLTGIMAVGNNIKAVITDMQGKTHLVGVGGMIGSGDTQVVAIDSTNQTVTIQAPGGKESQILRLNQSQLDDQVMMTPTGMQNVGAGEVSAESANKVLAAAKKAISEASSAISAASNSGGDASRAIGMQERAKDRLTSAQEKYTNKEYAKAKSLARSAESQAKRAKRSAENATEEVGEEDRRTRRDSQQQIDDAQQAEDDWKQDYTRPDKNYVKEGTREEASRGY
jgi:hypothetical protein